MKNFYVSTAQLARRMDPKSPIPLTLRAYRKKISYLNYEVKDLKSKLRMIRRILNDR
jgi:hypothetical protein